MFATHFIIAIQTMNGNTPCHVYVYNAYLVVDLHDSNTYVHCLNKLSTI